MAATHSEFFSIFIFLNFFGLINYFIVNFFLFSIFSPFSNYKTLKPLNFFPFSIFSFFRTLLVQTFSKIFYNIDYFYSYYNYIFLFYRSFKIKKAIGKIIHLCTYIYIHYFIYLLYLYFQTALFSHLFIYLFIYLSSR